MNVWCENLLGCTSSNCLRLLNIIHLFFSSHNFTLLSTLSHMMVDFCVKFSLLNIIILYVYFTFGHPKWLLLSHLIICLHCNEKRREREKQRASEYRSITMFTLNWHMEKHVNDISEIHFSSFSLSLFCFFFVFFNIYEKCCECCCCFHTLRFISFDRLMLRTWHTRLITAKFVSFCSEKFWFKMLYEVLWAAMTNNREEFSPLSSHHSSKL